MNKHELAISHLIELKENLHYHHKVAMEEALEEGIKALQERGQIVALVWEYINSSICDICYEDNCGGELSCMSGSDGEPCECHNRINEARIKLEKALRGEA